MSDHEDPQAIMQAKAKAYLGEIEGIIREAGGKLTAQQAQRATMFGIEAVQATLQGDVMALGMIKGGLGQIAATCGSRAEEARVKLVQATMNFISEALTTAAGVASKVLLGML